jgi:hypothetical protein
MNTLTKNHVENKFLQNTDYRSTSAQVQSLLVEFNALSAQKGIFFFKRLSQEILYIVSSDCNTKD